MISVLISTHGNTATKLLDTAEMIIGEQVNAVAVDFERGMGADDLRAKIDEAMKGLDTSEGHLFMVDLFSGTPFNVTSQIALTNPKMDIVTGVNVPMMMEVLLGRAALDFDTVVCMAETAGKEGIKLLSSTIKMDETDESEDEL